MAERATAATEACLDEKIAAAAAAVAQADILLLVTGAGWSADSGLPVYSDLAQVQVPAYERRGLTYADISQPDMIRTDPAIFYGFWGQALHDYRHTVPHSGYDIVTAWRRDKMENGIASEIRNRIKAKLEHSKFSVKEDSAFFSEEAADYYTPYDDLPVADMSGSFYCFTSNCDAHFYDYLPAVDIHDCHGNIELWQCTGPHCKSGIWRAPTSWNIAVDPETLEAPPHDQKLRSNKTKQTKESIATIDDPTGCTPRLGHSKGLGVRKNFLKYMPPGIDGSNHTDSDSDDNDETPNWPRCGHCHKLARPAIFMFGDFDWKYDHAQDARWNAWRETVIELSRESSQKLKVCIFEVGCGKNVATCRTLSENLLEDLLETGFGDDTHLVRINPDFAEADDELLTDYVISIRSKGLAALERIQELYKKLASSDTTCSVGS